MTPHDFSEFPILTTSRTRLRRIVPSDQAAAIALWDHPDVRRYLVEMDDEDRGESLITEIFDWAERIYTHKTGLRWAITVPPDDRLVGTCGLHLLDRTNRRTDIGYDLHPDHWRKGLMSEVVREVLRFCFEDLALHRVQADVTEGNQASAGLLRKVGFTQEGTWRETVYSRGQHHSLWQFGLLSHEWATD